MYRTSRFSRFAKSTARMAGHPGVFGLAALTIVVWLVTGPLFGFSDTWQLVINTGTTIVTFLMVFLIQNTQNRDGEAMQLKLDEIIRSLEGAHNVLLDTEELEEKELDHIRERYIELARQAREKRHRGESDVDTPEIAPDE
ncbi:MAG TPA: low affinity iron permease family protein [Gemmatimonadota bacterium]|nr:low affinity iron permease family protein [Gemmatimonadota bacterium]